MLSKTSHKDVAKDKASDLVSAAVDAAEAGRERLAPVVENVTAQLSEAAEKATDAAAPHVTRAKAAVAEAAAPQVATVRKKAREAAAEASQAAAPRVAEAKKQSRKQTKRQVKQAAKQLKQTQKQLKQTQKEAGKVARGAADAAAPHLASAKESTARTAELSSEQVRRLFNDEWMPRLHEAIAAAAATGSQAYAALPQQAAREAVDVVAPQAVTKRKKGGLLIALGLLTGAGAVALIVSSKNKAGAPPATALPEVERLDVAAAESTRTSSAALSRSDDAVGDAEKKADASLTGGRRGRHAARE